MPLDVAIKVDWQSAMDHATEKGGELPDLIEGALLNATKLPDEFENGGYWTRQQRAGNDGFAWCQYFGFGNQNYGLKSGQCRVVLVRRHPFTY